MVLGLSYALNQYRYGDFSNSSPNNRILSENKRYINHNINASVSCFVKSLFAGFTANKLLLLYEKKDEQGIEEINMKNYVFSTGYKFYNSPEKSFTFMPMSNFIFYHKNPRKYLDIAFRTEYSPEANSDKSISLGLAMRSLLDKTFDPLCGTIFFSMKFQQI